jgi:hypothetical protein
MRGFVSIETFVLFLILFALVMGFMPGLVTVVSVAMSGIDSGNPAYLALGLIPLALFFGPFRRLFNSGDE